MNHSSDNGARGGGNKPPPPPLQAALAEALGAFTRDPGGAARRLLDTAERSLAGAGGAGGGRGGDPVAGLAAAASRFLSNLQPPPVADRRGEVPGGQPAGDGPAGPAAAGGDGRAVPEGAAPAATSPTPFVDLRQRGEGPSFLVRADAVEAVVPAGEADCALHLSDGSTVEAGGCSSDDAARLLAGLVRLSQAGTQRGLYVRPAAVLAVAAPLEGGCALRLRGGRQLAATEAAAVAVGLLARDGG